MDLTKDRNRKTARSLALIVASGILILVPGARGLAGDGVLEADYLNLVSIICGFAGVIAGARGLNKAIVQQSCDTIR